MAAYDRLWGGYDWSWLRGGEWFAEEGHEIRLAQSPQFVLGARGHQVVVLESGGPAGSEWLVKPNGLIVLAAEPDLALSVEGTEVTAGCNIILRKHSGKAEYFNKWTWNSDGTIRLADMPSYDLNVKNGKVANGAAVIIWENRQPLAHNVWTSPAKSASSSSSAAETFRLKVVDTRGDPNTLWSSITGGVEVQTGYLAVSQAKNRDKKSSWAYIHEDYYHPDIVTFVKEHHGTTFLLKAINKAHKVLGYLSCAESLELDRRDGVSSYSYVHLDKSHATTFREEPCKDGFVLKTIDCVGAGGRQHHGHLCPIRFKDRPQDFGEDFTWLYVETETPNFAAVFVAQPVKGKGQEHPWWSDLVGKYYYVLIGCCCFVCIAVIAAIVAALTGGQAGMSDVPSDRPLQINVPYHCEHELISMWSRAKSAWCCEHYEKGCLTTTAATGPAAAPLVPWEQQPPKTADDDCFTDVLNWQRDWTISKQNFCCEHHGIGCKSALTSEAFDCMEGFHRWTEAWSARKKLWCCLHHERGCPADAPEVAQPAAYDCAEGYVSRLSWPQGKKEWCCFHASVACPDSNAKYDCAAGYASWKDNWPQAKKVWCCFHQSRGCHDADNTEYDCSAGFQNWQVDWSYSKKDFCCQHEGKGCAQVSQTQLQDMLQ